MAQPASLLSTLHGLSTSLKAAHPSSAPSSSALLSAYGAGSTTDEGGVPLTREAVKDAVTGIRDVLERFKTIWEEGGEDGRVRGAGKMKEWTQTTAPLLSLAPALHQLASSHTTSTLARSSPLFPLPPTTPFALPTTSSPAAVLEKMAKALGLEVFRESSVEPTPGGPSAEAVTTKETLILGATSLAVEIELTETSEGGWTVAKVSSVVTLDSGEDKVEGVDALLGGPLRELVTLMGAEDEQTGLEHGETRELTAARVLGELERRLKEIVTVDRAAKGSNLFKTAEEIKAGVDGWLESKGCDAASCSITPSTDPYPTYRVTPACSASPRPIAHQQLVHIIPTRAGATPARPLPDELLALAVGGGASDDWGSTSWEAIFEPALVVGVSGNSSSWGQTLLQQARSLTTPMTDRAISSATWETPNSTTPQLWTQAETPPMEGVAISRVAVRSVAEAGRVIEWSRAWSALNEFWLGVFDAPPSLPSAPPIVPLDLDDLEAFLLAPPPNLPITLNLLPSSHPSILLTLSHPTNSLSSLGITLTPTLAGPIKISLDPASETISEARLAVLGEKIGGWGQGLVRWVVEKLIEAREQGEDQGPEGAEREKRKREVQSAEGEGNEAEGMDAEEEGEGESKRSKI